MSIIGKTGHVTFAESGERDNVTLQLVSLQMDGLREVRQAGGGGGTGDGEGAREGAGREPSGGQRAGRTGGGESRGTREGTVVWTKHRKTNYKTCARLF